MKFLSKAPDGGVGSGVMGYFLVEIKPLFSIVLLHFDKGTRENHHSHAFNAITIWLKGKVNEYNLFGDVKHFKAGNVKYTPRSTFHMVDALESTWALSFRGPWVDNWEEYRKGKFITLTHGRKIVNE